MLTVRIITKLIANLIFACFILTHFAFADSYVQQAKKIIEQAIKPSAPWSGPISGPRAASDKNIIFIASDLKNSGVVGVSMGVKEAAKTIGWKVRVLDGAGSAPFQSAAVAQALALKPDGIIIGGFTPNTMVKKLKSASQRRVKIVSWHADPNPGPLKKYFISYNVTSDTDEVAKIAAMYAVAKSEGHAKVVILTDGLYSIAVHKANVMKSYIEKCTHCKVLAYKDTPIANTSERMPQLAISMLQQFGEQYDYTLAINDLYFDYIGPSLRSAGRRPSGSPYNISAGDGSESAFQRIRSSQFQVATVAEPLRLHGWQIIDELNRLLNGEAPSGYVTPVHLTVKENIDMDGGRRNIYDPDNGYVDVYKKIWGKR